MKRPLGVTILAILILMVAIAYLVRAATSDWGLDDSIRGEPWWFKAIALGARIVMGLLYGLIGLGLWRLRNWARGALLLLTISGYIIAVVALILEYFVLRLEIWTPPTSLLIVSFAWGVLVVKYFMRADIKRAFGIQ